MMGQIKSHIYIHLSLLGEFNGEVFSPFSSIFLSFELFLNWMIYGKFRIHLKKNSIMDAIPVIDSMEVQNGIIG